MDPASFQSRASARQLFTSIVEKLSKTVEPSAEPALSSSRDAVAPSSRHLFVLTHCLLPSIFLPALDILDQGLVVRCRPVGTSPSTVPTDEDKKETEDSAIKEDEKEVEDTKNIKIKEEVEAAVDSPVSSSPYVYYVRSSHPSSHPQNPKARFTHHLSSASKLLYEVRPHSWNCTCVAFSLSAYHNVYHPLKQGRQKAEEAEAERSPPAKRLKGKLDWFARKKEHGNENENENENEALEVLGKEVEDVLEKHGWEWGGVSRGEAEGRGPPVCKHLLACVLAERGGKVFGDLVVERMATEEEMAELAVLWD